MSGGCFDYECFRISNFADQVLHRIEVNDNQEITPWGNTVGRQYSAQTMATMKAAHKVIEQAALMAKEIEWLYSDDTGEDWFNSQMQRIAELYE